jgi:hypothetical protein
MFNDDSVPRNRKASAQWVDTTDAPRLCAAAEDRLVGLQDVSATSESSTSPMPDGDDPPGCRSAGVESASTTAKYEETAPPVAS